MRKIKQALCHYLAARARVVGRIACMSTTPLVRCNRDRAAHATTFVAENYTLAQAGPQGRYMELSGKHIFDAPREAVYRAMTDPAVLRRTLPGCQSLEPQGSGTYSITLAIGLAIIKGTYTGVIEVLNEVPPRSYSLKLDAKGGAGAVSGQGDFHLAPTGDSKTMLTYSGEAHIAGKIGFFARPLLKTGAAMVIGQFLRAMDTEVESAG